METLYGILLIAGGFALGGIMFCQLIPKIFLNVDIYAISADNNCGSFNVFKHCGAKWGIPCLTLDILKGFIPALLASLIIGADSFLYALSIVAPALGHAVGLFNRFRGGKCVAVSFGITLGIIPVTHIAFVTLALLYVLFSTVVKIRNAGKRSVAVYFLFAVIACTAISVAGQPFTAIGCGLLAALPITKFLFTKNGLIENRISRSDENNVSIDN